jgi:thiol:disulfide interchange protein DsbD
VGPLVNYGYSNHVGLITHITVPANWPVGTPFPLSADATWLVCEHECIPESGSFTLSLPTATHSEIAATEQGLFAAVRAQQPIAATFATTLSTAADTVALQIPLSAPTANQVIAAQFFPAQWGVVDHAAPQTISHDSTGLKIVTHKGELPTPAQFVGIIALTEQRDGQEIHTAYLIGNDATPAAANASIANAPAAIPVSIVMILLSALAGGVLLNLMPCVFPILAMKALAFVSHASQPTQQRVAGGLAYTVGVLLSFAILGAVLLILKAGGSVIGWGFQLQNPILVTLLAYVLFVAALNLSGMFEVSGRFMGVGSTWAARSGVSGSFFTGVLAAVVATPCTAPFMATAVGVAMTQSAAVAMTTFVALGLGLALPYLLLTFFPALARVLPKPGAWMNTLKQALAFPLYVSAAWLVWVVTQQSDANGVFIALLGMIMLALAIWLWNLSSKGALQRMLQVASSLVVVVISIALALSMQTSSAPATTQTAGNNEHGISQPFVQDRFDAARASGQPVFINLTAAWCVTCKVNERVALSGAAFKQALSDGGFTYFKGDWTNQNPDITRLLANFDRAGVPLYVVYPAHGGEPVVLPQLLTESIVVEALQSANGAANISSPTT